MSVDLEESSKNLKYFLTSYVLLSISSSFVSAFGIIFFFEKFNYSINAVLLLYGALYAVFAVTAHFGARLIQVLGMGKMMVIAVFFSAGATAARVFWEHEPVLFLSLFFIFFVLFKMLYWIPYHVELAAFTNKHYRGRQMALVSNVTKISSMIIPFLSGLILSQHGYTVLFTWATAFTIVSIIPLLFIHNPKEVYEWSFFQLLRELCKRKNRSFVLANFGNGLEDAVGTIVWPIFIFILLLGDYVSVGFISSVVFFTILVLSYSYGKLTDRYGSAVTVRYGTALQVSGWVLKVFVDSAVAVYFVDTYHKLGKTLNGISFQAAMYDGAEDNKHFVDEFLVLRETSFLIGKGLMCFVAIVVIAISSIYIMFILAACATLLMILVSKKVTIS